MKDQTDAEVHHGTLSITAHRSALQHAALTAAAVIQRHSRIPVLETMMLVAGPDGLRAAATDLDNYHTFPVEADVRSFGSICISPRRLHRIVSVMQGEITITCTDQAAGERHLTITDGTITATLRAVIPGTDYPRDSIGKHITTKPEDFAAAAIPETVFADALRATQVAISKEETRYYLNGIYFHQIGGKLVMASTDGHRLVRYSTGIDWPDLSFILPAKAARVIANRLIRGGNRSVEVMATQLQIRLSLGDEVISAKMIDGTYPDYNRIIAGIDATQKTAEFALSLDMLRPLMAMLAPFNGVVFDTGAGTASARTDDGDTIQMPLMAEGPGFQIGFRGSFLTDFCRTFGPMRVYCTAPMDPAKCLPENPAITAVVMPMRV